MAGVEDIEENALKYIRRLYGELNNKVKKRTLIKLFAICSRCVKKKELAKRVYPDVDENYAVVKLVNSEALNSLERYYIFLPHINPDRLGEFLVLTEIGMWIKKECLHGKELYLKLPDDYELLEVLAEIGKVIEQKENLKGYEIYFRLPLRSVVKFKDPNIEFQPEKYREWKRRGYILRVKICDEHLEVYDKEALEIQLSALAFDYMRNVILRDSDYRDFEDLEKRIYDKFKSKPPRIKDNCIEFEAEVKPLAGF